jgi:hypothetical protein
MALSLPFGIGIGRLDGAWVIGWLPALTLFGAGLIAGSLTAALAARLARSTSAIISQSDAPTSCTHIGLNEDAAPGGFAGLASQTGQGASLRIGVLGSLTINGQAGALVPAQSQLIVALALHGDGLSNKQLRGLLGADAAHPKPADSLRQLITRTRRALGRAPDGREWIEHRGHGVYALHPEARVDCLEFEALTAAGARAADPAPLARALSLVRGQPFTGCYYWWLEPAIVEAVTARIVWASETLAQLKLRGSDPAAAVRAARIGLAADQSAEQLWRIMMRAEHAAGNLAGVRGAWGRCLDVASEVAADGQPDSATEAVYSELLAR